MIHFINEGNEMLKNSSFVLPKGIRKHLKKTLDNYDGDKTIDGYKRINNLLAMEKISYQEMKRIKNFFDNYNGTKDSEEYKLNGGDEMGLWVNNTLNRATGAIHDFKQAKKDMGIKNAFIKHHEKDRQNKRKQKATIAKVQTKDLGKKVMDDETVKFESVQRRIIKLTESQFIELKENLDNHPYYEHIQEYSEYMIYSMFENGEPLWKPLINPSMYAKALQEFTKYGKFINFPEKYVYQWMGIIMRNTAILETCTIIGGHTQSDPFYEFFDYFFYDKEDEWEKFKEENGLEDDDLNSMWEYLDEIGFDEYMKLPDGSDAISDYGLRPLWEIIKEYNTNMEAEKVLVLINRCLDVVHCRGDLASAFIIGGSKTLSQISESRNNVKTTLNEAADSSFNLKELESLGSYTKRKNYCIQHLGKAIGSGSSRMVFQIDDERVLKLAKNEKGVHQNYNEYQSYGEKIGVTPITYAIDSQNEGYFIVSEFVLPAKQSDFKHCLGITFEEFCKFVTSSWVNHCGSTKNVQWYASYMLSKEQYVYYLENNEDLAAFDDYIGSTRAPIGDLKRIVNYGMTNRNGTPEIVLLDDGLSEEVWDLYYKRR